MTLEEKIQFIIDNDGSEPGEYFYGLQRFLEAVSHEDKDFFKALQPIVDHWYQLLKEDIEKERLYNLYHFEDLPDNCLIYTEESPELLIKVMDKLFNQLGQNVPFHHKQQFLIHTNIYAKNTSK